MANRDDGPKESDGTAKALAAMSPDELPPLSIHPNAKAIAMGWQNSELATQSLSPGLAATPAELFDDDGADAMCSKEAAAWLSKSFGAPAAQVDGKSNPAACRVYEFMGQAILSFSESGRMGTSWQFLLGPEGAHGGGRSYGRATQLSCDAKVAGFWLPFCRSMSAQMKMDPAQARASREARSIAEEAAAGPSVSKPRL